MTCTELKKTICNRLKAKRFTALIKLMKFKEKIYIKKTLWTIKTAPSINEVEWEFAVCILCYINQLTVYNPLRAIVCVYMHMYIYVCICNNMHIATWVVCKNHFVTNIASLLKCARYLPGAVVWLHCKNVLW